MTTMSRQRMQVKWAMWVSVMLAALAWAGVSQAAVDADLRAGVYPDADAVSVGGGVLAPMGGSTGWYFNPNVEVAMGSHRDLIAMSGDFHYDFAHQSNTSVWLGGGPAILVSNPEFGDSHTDLGINVLTGVGAKHGDVRPFAQLRGTMSDDSQIAIAGGVRF